ncbi:hypothetical protein NQP46_03410 [Streptomyces albus]|nr:hypothetical protein NQP46_03410 [Streptomyces albus]
MGQREARAADGSVDTEKETGVLASRQAALLWLACAAQFMVVLDVSVVNVALPTIQTALGFDAAGLQWVVGSYALVFAGFLLLGGSSRTCTAVGGRSCGGWRCSPSPAWWADSPPAPAC